MAKKIVMAEVKVKPTPKGIMTKKSVKVMKPKKMGGY